MSFEYSQNAKKFISATKRGRRSLYIRKCLIAGLTAVAMMILWVSDRVRNMSAAKFLSFFLFCIPAGLLCIGFEGISFCSVLRPVMAVYYSNHYGFHSIMWAVPEFIVMALGAGCALNWKKRG